MLVIKNPNDIAGMNFVDGRYVLNRVEEHNHKYEFEFKDNENIIPRLVYVSIIRKPEWDSEENRNMYKVDNGSGMSHKISVEFFSKIKNVQWTFTEALKVL